MADPQPNENSGQNLNKVIEVASSVKTDSLDTEINSRGMWDGYGNFIKFNDRPLPDKF